jgi:putative endopeptidase
MAVRFLAANAPVLPHEIDDANFAFYGTVLSASRSNGRAGSARSGRPRPSSASSSARSTRRAISRRRARPRWSNSSCNLRSALAGKHPAKRVDDRRDQARGARQARRVRAAIGYPEHPKTYDGLVIAANAPLANAIGGAAWQRN